MDKESGGGKLFPCCCKSHGTMKIVPSFLFFNLIKMMLGSKGLLPPLIPDCSVLCTPAIPKNIQNPLTSKLALNFRPFDPGIMSFSLRESSNIMVCHKVLILSRNIRGHELFLQTNLGNFFLTK